MASVDGLVVQSFLRDGLMPDITLAHVPILLGSGHPLFGALENDIELKRLGTTAYASGMVHSKYEVMSPTDGAAYIVVPAMTRSGGL